MINNKLKDYITYMLLIIIIGLFITNYRSIRKELKHYREELEELETERTRIMENINDSLEDIKRRSNELEDGNKKLKQQLQNLQKCNDACLFTPISADVIQLLREAGI